MNAQRIQPVAPNGKHEPTGRTPPASSALPSPPLTASGSGARGSADVEDDSGINRGEGLPEESSLGEGVDRAKSLELEASNASIQTSRDGNLHPRVGYPAGLAPVGCGFGCNFSPTGAPAPDPRWQRARVPNGRP